MDAKNDEILERLHAQDREYRHLVHIAALLQWDQETMLPPDGVEDRSEQLALIEGLAHERLVKGEVGRLLSELGSSSENPAGDEKLPPVERDFLKVLRRTYDRAVLLPQEFVTAAASAQGLSQAAWVIARKNDDFAAFSPHLKTMVDLAKKKAEYWGYDTRSAYDALLGIYEPGLTAAGIAALFTPLRERLSALLGKIAARPQIEASFLDLNYDTVQQEKYNRELMAALGYDLRRGRLDIAAHPFTTTLGFNDVRITSRYFENNLLSSIFSTIHESGHAFYELGVDPALRGTSLAEGVSMGIHESQSRLWENVIGRSHAFWEGRLKGLKGYFPKQLEGVGPDVFYRGANRVRPGLIRVEADEVSYSLHVILRFELERRIFSGELSVEDLSDIWRKSMKEFLGIEPENDALGVLQDVHWSEGYFGYFPSYALGNLYGLQFWKKLQEDLPDAEGAIAQGDYRSIHAWLAGRIHTWGRRLDPPDLLKQATGDTLSAEPFLKYIEAKYTELYGL
jgi:carboxypeptidase Taq